MNTADDLRKQTADDLRKQTADDLRKQTADDLRKQVEEAIKAMTESGVDVVGHFGTVTSGSSHQKWWSIRYGEAVTRLLSNPDYKVAQILSVLGSEVRLAILRCLLGAPRTAAEIVVEVGLKTTGQAYHHLRELERGGYIEQRSGGQYHFGKNGRVYLAALALAADAGAEEPEEVPA